MARVDAYGEIGNDLGTHQSVGGARGNAHRVWARLNTDNAGGARLCPPARYPRPFQGGTAHD